MDAVSYTHLDVYKRQGHVTLHDLTDDPGGQIIVVLDRFTLRSGNAARCGNRGLPSEGIVRIDGFGERISALLNDRARNRANPVRQRVADQVAVAICITERLGWNGGFRDV